MNAPQTPRALAIQVAELETKLNASQQSNRELHQYVANLLAENKRLQQIVGEAKHEVDQLMAQSETQLNNYMAAAHDVKRFVWWFHNGHNVDEQLFELNRQRALDPKSVTLDMWRNAIDAAMEKKRART